ncbi:MAG: pseudaminic acid synthase [Vicinamibacterales bacterium]
MTIAAQHATFHIGGRTIGAGHPVYLVAELSANHGGRYEDAVALIDAAADAGADAIKVQTYTPDTMTIDAPQECFTIRGSVWNGRKLYELYAEAHMPWEWHAPLQKVARRRGLDFFSTPFDASAVDFLEQLDVPVHKVASFEIIDIPLLRRISATGKPVIVSTGMATAAEVDEAVSTFRDGGTPLALLKCTSAYPAPPESMNLRAIPYLAQQHGVVVGLSDHTLDLAVPVAAVALGACIIEKHFTLSRKTPGPDSAFSLEPHEFRAMVDAVRTAEQSLGLATPALAQSEDAMRVFRRSLFVVSAMRAGEAFTPANVRSIRPADGLHPRYLDEVLGRRATRDIEKGTPLDWSLVG